MDILISIYMEALNDLGKYSNCDYFNQYCDLVCNYHYVFLCSVLFTKQAINHSVLWPTQHWKQSTYKLFFLLGWVDVLRWIDAWIAITSSFNYCIVKKKSSLCNLHIAFYYIALSVWINWSALIDVHRYRYIYALVWMTNISIHLPSYRYICMNNLCLYSIYRLLWIAMLMQIWHGATICRHPSVSLYLPRSLCLSGWRGSLPITTRDPGQKMTSLSSPTGCQGESRGLWRRGQHERQRPI